MAATPETVKKFIALGAVLAVEEGAGNTASIPDAAYSRSRGRSGFCSAGGEGAISCWRSRRPMWPQLAGAKPGAWVAAIFDPFGQRERVDAYAAAGHEALAMGFMPRITRAQSMDVLPASPTFPAIRR